MTTLEQLKQELEQRKQAKVAELAELKESITLRHELSKLDSPLYNNRELTKTDSTKLDILLSRVEEIYSLDSRKITHVYGYGIVPNKILTLLKAIQYTKASEKEELLMLTGLDEQIVEDTLDNFGNTAYFSKQSIEIVPEIPMDIAKTKELLKLVAVDMHLVSELDLSKFSIDNVRYQSTRARVRAEEMLNNTKEYIDTALTYEE